MDDISEHQIDRLREAFAACLARRIENSNVAHTALNELDAAAVEALNGARSLIGTERADQLDDGARTALEADEVATAWTLAQVARWAASQRRESDPEVALNVEAYAWASVARCEKALGEKELVVQARNREADIWQSLAEENDDDPAVLWHLAKCLKNRGVALRALGHFDEPTRDYSVAIDILQRLIDDGYEEDIRSDLIEVFNARERMYYIAGQLQQSIKDESAVIDLLRAMVKDDPGIAENHQMLARALWHRAASHSEVGQLGSALRDQSTSIQLLQKLVRDHPNVPDYRDDLADAYCRRAGIHTEMGQYDNAISDGCMSVDIFHGLVNDYPDKLSYQCDWARYLSFRAETYEEIRDFTNALADESSAIGIIRVLISNHPDDRSYQTYYARYHYDRARILSQLDQLDQAAKDNNTAVTILSGLSRDDPDDPVLRGELADALDAAAVLRQPQDQSGDIFNDSDDGITLRRSMVRDYPDAARYRCDLADFLVTRAEIRAEAGQIGGAVNDLDEAWSVTNSGTAALVELEVARRLGETRADILLATSEPELDGALDSLELAIQAVELMRRGRTTAREREAIFVEHGDLYPRATEIALTLAATSPAGRSSVYVERAYGICLRRTARSLSDGLGAGPDDELVDLTPDERHAVDEVDRRIADLRRMILGPDVGEAGPERPGDDADDPRRRLVLLRQPEDLLAEYAALEGERQRLVGRLGVDAPTVDQVRSALKPGELLLDGFIGDEIAGWFALRQGQPVRWVPVERAGLAIAANGAFERWRSIAGGGVARLFASAFRRRVEDLCAALLPNTVIEELTSAHEAFVAADLVLHNLPLLRGIIEALQRAMRHPPTATMLPGGGLLVPLRADRPRDARDLDVLTVGADIHGDLELVDRAVRMTAEQYRDLRVEAHPTHDPVLDRFIGDDLLTQTVTTYLFQYDGHAGVRTSGKTAEQDVALFFAANRRGSAPGESPVLGREIQLLSKMRMEVALILGCFSSFVDGVERSEYLGLGRSLFQRCRVRALVLCLYAVPDAACAWYAQELHRIWREPGRTLAEAHTRALDSLAVVTPSQLASHGIDLQGKPRALRGSDRHDERRLRPNEPAFSWHQVAAFTLIGEHDLPTPGSRPA